MVVTGSPQVIRRNSQGYRIGECHHNAKLSDDDVRLMGALRVEYGLSYGVIAGKFECSKSTAYHAIKRRYAKLCER
jgi:predicted transcriptional regulator